jgi:hypothetical protein
VHSWPVNRQHAPATHFALLPHVVAQLPQWALSVWRLTQAPEQLVSPDGQLVAQVPEEQTWPEAQTVLQDPQWALSVWRLTQVPEQLVSPD